MRWVRLLLLSGILCSAPSHAAEPTHILDIGNGLSLPTDVAVTRNHVAVVDSGNHRIVVFNSRGELLFSFGSRGSGNGEFESPVGIDSDDAGYLFVSDKGNHRVQVFTDTGRFVRTFPIVSDGEKIRPVDVAVDSQSQQIIVTGNNNHKVMVLGRGGDITNEWGGNGAGESEFRYPATLALLSDRRLAVVDVLNTRVQMFDQQGTFIIQVADWGVLPGQLFRPKGIAVDEADRIYISDSYMEVIQVFSDTGKFLHVLGVDVETPTGMDIEGDRLYVTEMTAGKVSVYALP